MEATAKYDFKATAKDELSFKKEETLKVKEHTHTCCITRSRQKQNKNSFYIVLLTYLLYYFVFSTN